MNPNNSTLDTGIRNGSPGDHHSDDEGIRSRPVRRPLEVASRRGPALTDHTVSSEFSTLAVQITFDGSPVDGLNQNINKNAPPGRKRRDRRRARAPWAAAVRVTSHAVGMDPMKAWRQFSKTLVAEGCRRVLVQVPAEYHHLLHSPGLFGQPDRVGESGDDHWERRDVVVESDRVFVVLVRPGWEAEVGLVELVRGGAPFILAVPVARGEGFIGLALPVVRTARPRVQTSSYSTSEAAVAAATRKAIRLVAGDVVVVTSQQLVMDGDVRARTPEVAVELLALRRAEESRDGRTDYVKVLRSGRTVQECVRVWVSRRFSSQ